ncbi:cytochrome P450 family protein [Streptomyces xinghaiensis]|uniref:cytochrome P450 family protein n=1 Tax=Streptomyces xinghaiensis TaxID=1038928 RepID=UPI0002DF6FC6|nr:cytochrome P450 [Streptomyces xinghaiensis]MZE80242.1 cytochrome P450 [Streptomyces sp. SID5475]
MAEQTEARLAEPARGRTSGQPEPPSAPTDVQAGPRAGVRDRPVPAAPGSPDAQDAQDPQSPPEALSSPDAPDTSGTPDSPIIDLTAYGDRFTVDPYSVYAELRDRGPAHRVRVDEQNVVWLIVGHEEGRAALADPRLSKDWRAAPDLRFRAAPVNANMLDSDPPDHTRLRRLVAREFTSRRVESLRPRVEEITGELLDAMAAAPDGRADLVEALAFPLPMSVICELLGVPSLDRASFRAWSNEVVAPTSPEAGEAAMHAVGEYLAGLIEEKRRHSGDDLLSGLIRTTDEDGDRLTPDELVGMAFLLLVAGHETTVNLITNGVHALLRHPDSLAALRADLSLTERAVEETLRWDGPVENSTFRYSREPLEVGGVTIPARQAVVISLAAADRDPARFPEADRFDLHRRPGGHLAFGHGIHFCLGAPLARMEGQIAIRRLLERFPDLALDLGPDRPAGDLPWIPGLLIRGLRRLPLRLR